jgi:hypothetical protein
MQGSNESAAGPARHPLWKLNRLRAMGLREIVYRAGRAAKERLERRGIGLAAPTPPTGNCGAPWCASIPKAFDVAAYCEAADRILAGQFNVFVMRDARLGFPPPWNCDPKTGTVPPMVFGKSINYRDERVVGDIKYLWEPNRHLELVTLAQAWHLTGEEKYADGCRTLLESWFDACPYPMGINWTSSLELALRLVNWYFAWQLLGGDNAPVFAGAAGMAFRTRWHTAVFQHCHFIAGHLSLHSSANNHLLGEYTGLLVGALAWPLWPQSASWRRIAAVGFETEALRQNTSDGVNREHAVYYQHEVIDMMLLCGLIGRANDLQFGAAFWERLQSMIAFLAAVMDRGGHIPMIGDADDAVMVRLAPWRGFDVYRSLLATGAVLFERAEFAAKAGTFDDKSRWLLGNADLRFDALLNSNKAQTPRAQDTQAFAQGGYYVLGVDLGGPNEIRLVADAGPLGYLSIAAHGHADALAFTLSVAGLELLIDPGTYAYHTGRPWRDYFRGTAAHNTVRVDGQDQSVSGGSFLWLRHARAQCECFETGDIQDRFVGVHDGYIRLPDPVTHRREIVLDKVRCRIEVVDELECAGTHDVEVFWHFAEDCQVELAGSQVEVSKGGVRLRLRTTGADLTPECVKGRYMPLLGWVSRSFDQKTASPSVRWFGRVTGSSKWLTTLTIETSN